MEAYIYALRERAADKPFYIGSTLYPNKRLADHLAAVQNGTNANRHFCNTVRKIGLDRVVMDVVEIVPKEARWDAEVDWIKRTVGQGVNLTNRYHNGFEYTERRKVEEYGEEYALTPEKWHWAKALRESDYQPPTEIAGLLWGVLCATMDEMESRFPDEMAEFLSGGPDKQAGSLY